MPRARHLPHWLIRRSAALCETGATILRRPSPLTRDLVEIGCVSCGGQTNRTRAELLEQLKYPAFDQGKATLA